MRRELQGSKAQKQKACTGFPVQALLSKSRRRPTLPLGLPSSTIGSKELNFRVRDGIGCDLLDITTGNLSRAGVFAPKPLNLGSGSAIERHFTQALRPFFVSERPNMLRAAELP